MMTAFKNRAIGKDGPIVGPMGIGTWAMGGPFFSNEKWLLPAGSPIGYGKTDDKASIRAIHCAIDSGIKFIDTADAYGAGHCETLLGEALKGRREDVFLATKFGNVINEKTKELIGTEFSERYIRFACEASLRRLETDRIDLYQLHISDLAIADGEKVGATLSALRDEGKIQYFGWSTDDPQRADRFAKYPAAACAQFRMNIFERANEMLEVRRNNDFAAIIRSPLAMGFLSGKYTVDSVLPADDIRRNPPLWLRCFVKGGGADARWLARLDSVRDILTSGGRTMVQGALGWIWAQSDLAIPIPGIRNEKQAIENTDAMAFGPLNPEQVAEIDALLREAEFSENADHRTS